MSDWGEVAGGVLVLLGAVFLFSAGLGLVRMPDPFTRIQAGTKATTLGAVLVMVGLAVLEPGWTPKLALFVFFIFASNPISSHALARAAERSGTPMAPQTRLDGAAAPAKPREAGTQ